MERDTRQREEDLLSSSYWVSEDSLKFLTLYGAGDWREGTGGVGEKKRR